MKKEGKKAPNKKSLQAESLPKWEVILHMATHAAILYFQITFLSSFFTVWSDRPGKRLAEGESRSLSAVRLQGRQVQQACGKQAGAWGRAGKPLWAAQLPAQPRTNKCNRSQGQKCSSSMADTGKGSGCAWGQKGAFVHKYDSVTNLARQCEAVFFLQRHSFGSWCISRRWYIFCLPSTKAMSVEFIQNDLTRFCYRFTSLSPVQQALQDGYLLSTCIFQPGKLCYRTEEQVMQLHRKQSMAGLGISL